MKHLTFALIFVIGIIVGANVFAGDHETVTKEVEKIVWVPDTKTVEKTVEVPADVPEACVDMVAKFNDLDTQASRLSQAHGSVDKLLSRVQTVMQSDDPTEVIDIKRELKRIQEENSQAWNDLATSSYAIGQLSEKCGIGK